MLPLRKTDFVANLAHPFGKPLASLSSALPTDDTLSYAKNMNQIRKWGCHFDGRDCFLFLGRIEKLQ